MKKQKEFVNGKASGLVKTLYVLSAILMVIFIYMVVMNMMYINNYAGTYGISVSDMMMDTVQYIIAGSMNYFVYSVLVFCAAKIIRLLQKGNSQALEKAESRSDKNIDKNDIPESEDAIEVVEVIEDK